MPVLNVYVSTEKILDARFTDLLEGEMAKKERGGNRSEIIKTDFVYYHYRAIPIIKTLVELLKSKTGANELVDDDDYIAAMILLDELEPKKNDITIEQVKPYPGRKKGKK